MFRRGASARLAGVALVAGLVTLPAVGAAGAAPASSPPTHQVQIDGTSLSTSSLNLYNPDGTSEQIQTGTVQTLTLEEGTYSFNAGGGAIGCDPTLLPSGTWSVPSSCGAAASGDGTTTLDLTGVPVTVSTAGLSTGLLVLLYGLPAIPAGGSVTWQLMPEASQLVEGSGDVSSCGLIVPLEGAPSAPGCGQAAVASGSTVDFVGYPVSVDATALSTTGYVFNGAISLDAQEQTGDAVHQYQLVPGPYEFAPGSYTSFLWDVGPTGAVEYPQSDAAFLAGNGTSSLVVRGEAVTVNATGLGSGSWSMGGAVFGSTYSQAQPTDLTLVPGAYGFVTTGAAPAPFPWTLSTKDKVAIPTSNACAYGSGAVLTVDCSPPTFTMLTGAPNAVTQGSKFTITAMECDRVADVYATGTISLTDVTTGKSLGTVSLKPSSQYVNCGAAKLTDTEALAPGQYRIKGVYRPGGSVPVPTSRPGYYTEKVVAAP